VGVVGTGAREEATKVRPLVDWSVVGGTAAGTGNGGEGGFRGERCGGRVRVAELGIIGSVYGRRLTCRVAWRYWSELESLLDVAAELFEGGEVAGDHVLVGRIDVREGGGGGIVWMSEDGRGGGGGSRRRVVCARE
jgi:hypothetical protein